MSPPNSQKNDLETRIDQFFGSVTPQESDQVEHFVSRLYESYTAAERAVPRQFLSFILAWVLFYAVAKGIVTEADVASFKIAQLSLLPAFGPPILGFFSYTLASAAFLNLNLGFAFWQCYKHILPQAFDRNLERLLGPPTFIRAERMTRDAESKIHEVASTVFWCLIIILGMVGTLIAVVHVSFLAWNVVTLPYYVRVTVIAIGAVAWLRSFLLWVRSADF